jgi:hypothetical protein
LNYALYVDVETDTLLVDHVIKYNHLNAELTEICDKLGIPFSGTLTERAKTTMRPSNTREYRSFLNTEQRDIISDKFHKEIKFHN